MTRPLLFNAFLMNTPSHIQHGQWRHPDAHQVEFEGLDLWTDLARTLERGLFDAMFFADVSGLYGPADGVYTDNVHEGLQIPSNDPTVLLGALAAVTSRIGLATTSNVMQNHPFNFARQISTLDHLSKGRIAWNIVTSTQENAARNFGLPALVEHDARYEWAEEYVDVAYKLWEGSWEDDAVLVDRATRSTTWVSATGSRARTFPRPARSALPCCSRRADRHGASHSLPGTRRPSSSRRPTRTSRATTSPRPASWPWRTGGRLTTSCSSPG
jgi:alkanesulfonate monooxygenase SsuD/methylene tetrahydromethanopterin reductase-like flavin-dependent oxidoreductase (luciferase family)